MEKNTKHQIRKKHTNKQCITYTHSTKQTQHNTLHNDHIQTSHQTKQTLSLPYSYREREREREMMSNGIKTQHVIGAFIITCDTHTQITRVGWLGWLGWPAWLARVAGLAEID